jgi:hypothetical protein
MMSEQSEQIEMLQDVALAVRRVGGFSSCARLLVARGLRDECTPQAVMDWVSKGYCPPDAALLLEELTGIDRVHLVSEKLKALCCPSDRRD